MKNFAWTSQDPWKPQQRQHLRKARHPYCLTYIRSALWQTYLHVAVCHSWITVANCWDISHFPSITWVRNQIYFAGIRFEHKARQGPWSYLRANPLFDGCFLPVSSFSSLTAASWGVSPLSTRPAGNCRLYLSASLIYFSHCSGWHMERSAWKVENMYWSSRLRMMHIATATIKIESRGPIASACLNLQVDVWWLVSTPQWRSCPDWDEIDSPIKAGSLLFLKTPNKAAT